MVSSNVQRMFLVGFVCVMLHQAVEAGEYKVDVDVMPGKSLKNNVGCGFPLIKDESILNLMLKPGAKIISSKRHSCNPANTWFDKTKVHWRVVGVEPHEKFWVIIEAEVEPVADKPKGKGKKKKEGEEPKPEKRWVSVSDVDLDADTDNNMAAYPRMPDEGEKEDKLEYPIGSKDFVVGVLIGANDDIDVSRAHRDSYHTLEKEKEDDLHKIKLKISAKKKGKYEIRGRKHLFLYDEDGKMYRHAGVIIPGGDVLPAYDANIPAGNYTKTFYMETDKFAKSGDSYYLQAYFIPAPPAINTYSRDYVRYTVIAADIDVDSDNSGKTHKDIEAKNHFNNGEDFFENHPEKSGSSSSEDEFTMPDKYQNGMVVGVNDDDTDGNGKPDNGFVEKDKVWTGPDGATVQGEADREILRPLWLNSLELSSDQKSAIEALESGTPTLRVTKTGGNGAVRLFTLGYKEFGVFKDDDDSIAKHPARGDLWDILAVNQGLAMGYWVEGLRGGEVELEFKMVLTPSEGDDIVIHRDKVRITVIDASLTLFKRDDTTKVVKKMDPGAYIALNNNDDDTDGNGTTADKDDADGVTKGDPDLVKAEFKFGKFFDGLKRGVVTIERANDKITLWKKNTKKPADVLSKSWASNKISYDLSKTQDFTDFNKEIKNKTLWVEGISASKKLKDSFLKLTYDPGSVPVINDETKVTVFDCSLTIYPGNGNKKLTMDKEIDPGAYFWLNKDDDDKDGKVDNTDANEVKDENDLAKTEFSFGDVFDGLDKGKVIIERKNDRIRLWKTSTKKAGTEIAFTANKKEYDLSKAAGRTAFVADIKDKNLYTEGAKVSGKLKDTELKLIYEDGDSPSVPVCEDPIKITVFDLKVTDMSFNHDRTKHDADAVNIRKSYAGAKIKAPEWRRDGVAANNKGDEVLYVRGKRVTIKATLAISPDPKAKTAEVYALGKRKALATGGSTVFSLGNLGKDKDVARSPKKVTFTAGKATDVAFVPQNAVGSRVVREEVTFEWITTKIGGVELPNPLNFTPVGQGGGTSPIMGNLIKIYTIYGNPQAPWKAAETAAANANDKTQPWVSALEFAIVTSGANNKPNCGTTSNPANDTMAKVTKFLHDRYRYQSNPRFLPNPYNATSIYDYTGYTTAAVNTKVNCFDSAIGLRTTFCLLGISNVKGIKRELVGHGSWTRHCFVEYNSGAGKFIYDCTWHSLFIRKTYAFYNTIYHGTDSVLPNFNIE